MRNENQLTPRCSRVLEDVLGRLGGPNQRWGKSASFVLQLLTCVIDDVGL